MLPGDGRKRVVIERVTPSVDDGRFPARRTAGDLVHVEADIFADGHDSLAATLLSKPHTSIIWDLEYEWNDAEWMARRKDANSLDAPISIYEVHLGSWRRDPNDPHRCLSYRELAEQLVPYVREMGFTHVEFLPVMEHPFYGSWGLPVGGLFRSDWPLRHATGPDVAHRIAFIRTASA